MDQPLKQRPAIELDGVHVTLPSRAGAVAILRGIDLVVASGEAVAVVGPSGSGKSTLLMVVAGLERATAGRVTVVGSDLGTLDEDGLARLRAANIGIVFQSFHLVPTMTAIENVALPMEFLGPGRRLHGRPRVARRGRAFASRDAFPRPALRRRAAARRHRPGARHQANADPRRRAHRQSRPRHGRTSHGSPLRAQRQDRRDAPPHHP